MAPVDILLLVNEGKCDQHTFRQPNKVFHIRFICSCVHSSIKTSNVRGRRCVLHDLFLWISLKVMQCFAINRVRQSLYESINLLSSPWLFIGNDKAISTFLPLQRASINTSAGVRTLSNIIWQLLLPRGFWQVHRPGPSLSAPTSSWRMSCLSLFR